MWISIEKGGDAVSLTERINRRQEEKERLEAQLAEEQNKRVILTEAQVLAFLNYVCELPGNDMMKRRAIINIFVHSIYLYDDHLTLIINGSNKPVTVDDIPFDDIEAAFNGEKAAMEQCSNSSDIVPPNESQTNTDSHTRNVVPPKKSQSNTDSHTRNVVPPKKSQTNTDSHTRNVVPPNEE